MPSERLNSNPLAGIYRRLLSRTAHLIVGVLAVLAMAFCGFDATRTRASDGTVWLLGRPTLEILDILPGGTALDTPLRRGDIIVGIANSLTPTPQKAAEVLRQQRPGGRVPYLIKRNNRQFPVPVPLVSTRVDLADYSVNVMLALVYVLIGFAVFLRGRNERATSLFFILCLLFGLYFMTNLQQASYYLGMIITQNIGAFARFMLPAVFLHFFLVFPRKKLTLTQHPFLAPLLYILPLMFYLRFTLNQFVGSEGAKIEAGSWIILGVYYVLGLGALLHGYFSYRDPLMRQRVRILTLGTLVAVIPFLIFKIGMDELTYRSDLARLGVVPLVAIPVSFGYCVARYRVIQIDLLMKKSLLHGLLSGLIWLVYLAVAWWAGGKILGLVPGTSPLIAAGTTLAVATALWPLRSNLQGRLDRRFYYSRSNMSALIEEFSKEIPRLIQRDSLLERVGRRLCEVLQIPDMAIYLTTHDPDEPALFSLASLIQGPASAQRQRTATSEARHQAEGGARVIALDRPDCNYPGQLVLQAVARQLQIQGEPLWADAEAADSLGDRQAITREQAELEARVKEQRFLLENGIQLLIPLTTQGRLVGLMALPQRSDTQYEVYELQLLTIVSGQVALQVENARLYEEEVAKQKLEEEMALARQIQARLLPGSLPTIAGVQMQAVNISSKQVSGDYYDVIHREDGRLALVIADVSGKGMPASILASNLQAALRAQCYHCSSTADVLSLVNRQIHASTDPQHFATLFLAIFDPRTRRLLYSSGGHNAPVVLRRDGSIQLLEKGGLPLGAFDFGTYEEEEIVLGEGDLLFLYTDGLTETKGPDGEEDFGETRLEDLLLRNRGDDVQGIFTRINEELRAFSGRKEADDDITMIGLKIEACDQDALAGSGQS